MERDYLPIGFAIVALFLAGMEARAAVLVGRSAGTHESSALNALSAWMILVAGLANVIWAFRTWSWWVFAALGVIAFASGFVVTLRSFGLWLSLRPLVAVATAASAAILWVAYPPSG